MSKESIVIFDDGSIESKVLQYELKDKYNIKIINVGSLEKLDKWVDKVIIGGLLKNIVKIFLHFPIEDYIQKDIRTEIMEIEHNNPNIRIIPWYEQAPRDGIKNRAINYGIQEPKFKAVKQTEVASQTIKAGPVGKYNESIDDEFVDRLKEIRTQATSKPFSVEKHGGEVAITDRTVKSQGQSDPFKELVDKLKDKRRRKDAKHE